MTECSLFEKTKQNKKLAYLFKASADGKCSYIAYLCDLHQGDNGVIFPTRDYTRVSIHSNRFTNIKSYSFFFFLNKTIRWVLLVYYSLP